MDSDSVLRRHVRIHNPQGLHMRPAMAFARLAMLFQSSINIHHAGRCVNGKSIIELMMLGVEPGVELMLEVSGADAAEAMPVLEKMLSASDPDSLITDNAPTPG